MKYLKLFEELYYDFEDAKWKIQIIKNGPNKGKINILKKYYNENRPREDSWTKFSPLAGCVKFLDTRYEKNPKIREIQHNYNSRVVNVSTMDAVFRNFLSKLGYKNKKDLFGAESLLRELRTEFGQYIQDISNRSKNLGDLMDGLKEIEELVETHITAKKYNI